MVRLIHGDQNGPLPLGDIQGFILRGYNFPQARHFFINLPQVAAGRTLLASLAPLVTSAAPWGDVKPDTCLNLGITAAGLAVFNIPTAGFPVEFSQGAVARAATVGDIGNSAPAQWEVSLGASDPASQTHILVSLYAQSPALRESGAAQVEQLCTAAGARVIGTRDSDDLPLGFIHFNYADGISEPNVVGAVVRKSQEDASPVPAGEFVLGYPNQDGTTGYPLPAPLALTRNGSYSAFRILEQDVDTFEAFLDDAAKETGVAREMVKAKLCGRWTNGSPLVLHPDQPADLPVDHENVFNYDANDDQFGHKCPIGSHIRRSHPRDTSLMRGGPTDGFRHRIMRRAAPYGPPWQPKDGVERGLIGHFICGDIGNQFEFVMQQWVNGDAFGTRNGIEPLLGATDPATSVFRFTADGTRHNVTGFARFTITRGGAYLFLPSISGIKYLAAA
jgi:deferrochelatase/peroxidase EfeB